MRVRLLAVAIGGIISIGAHSAWAAGPAQPAKFAACMTCHSVAKGAPAGLGPNLHDVSGRKAGTAPGFNYSAAMKGSNLVWTKANLVKFIMAPKGAVPGNRMSYAGVKDQAAAEAIAGYLESLGSARAN